LWGTQEKNPFVEETATSTESRFQGNLMQLNLVDWLFILGYCLVAFGIGQAEQNLVTLVWL